MELGEYASAFLANKIDGEMLQELEEHDLLNDFGMLNKYHRRRLLQRRAACTVAGQGAERRECVVCLGADVSGWMMLRPCGHVCVCTTCCQSLKLCPVCREAITDSFAAFF
jgi:hypothetical protein